MCDHTPRKWDTVSLWSHIPSHPTERNLRLLLRECCGLRSSIHWSRLSSRFSAPATCGLEIRANPGRAGETAPSVKGFAWKREGLSFIPRIHIFKKARCDGVNDPSSGEAETQGSLGLADQRASLPGKFRSVDGAGE